MKHTRFAKADHMAGSSLLLAIALFLVAAVFMVLRGHGYLREGTAGFVIMLYNRLSCLFFAGTALTIGLLDGRKIFTKIMFALGLCAVAAAAFFALRNPVRDLMAWPSWKTVTVSACSFERIHTVSRRSSTYYRLNGYDENGDAAAFDLNKATYKKYKNKGLHSFAVTYTPYTESVIRVEVSDQ